MTGAYDDLSQEMWNSADDNMPQDYLDSVLAQIILPKRPLPKTDSDLDSDERFIAKCLRRKANTRFVGQALKDMPRFGQPSFDAPLVDWYHEYRYRNLHPLWYTNEYRYTDDGTLIHRRQ